MTVRLNVVVVQSPRMTSLQVGVVADIVIQLLGRPGIDVAMVSSLQPDDEHSTDRLMLTGIENDLAVIDWRSAEQTLASLAELGLSACQAPHALDPDVKIAVPGQRRVYIFDLRLGFKADQVVATLNQLWEQRQVVTVSIAGLKPPPSNGKSNSLTSPNDPSPSVATASITVSQTIEQRPHSIANHDDAQLDALVDSLNDIDL